MPADVCPEADDRAPTKGREGRRPNDPGTLTTQTTRQTNDRDTRGSRCGLTVVTPDSTKDTNRHGDHSLRKAVWAPPNVERLATRNGPCSSDHLVLFPFSIALPLLGPPAAGGLAIADQHCCPASRQFASSLWTRYSTIASALLHAFSRWSGVWK